VNTLPKTKQLNQNAGLEQGFRKLALLAPPVPDKPHLIGQNKI
jgi:hypothetical protein